MARPQRGARATRPDDGPTLTDAAPWGTFQPSVGWWAQTPGVLGVVSASPPLQACYAYPFPIGPVGFEVDTFRYRVATAASGGLDLKAEVGLFRDDGSGFPDADQRLASATTTDFSAGLRDLSFTPVFLTPGLYWMMWVWFCGQAPSTYPQFSAITNSSYGLPAIPSQPPGAMNRAYMVTRTTLPPSASQYTRGSAGMSGSNVVPLVMLRRSA